MTYLCICTKHKKYQSNGYMNKRPKRNQIFSSFTYLILFMHFCSQAVVRKEISRNINSIGYLCHTQIISCVSQKKNSSFIHSWTLDNMSMSIAESFLNFKHNVYMELFPQKGAKYLFTYLFAKRICLLILTSVYNVDYFSQLKLFAWKAAKTKCNCK